MRFRLLILLLVPFPVAKSLTIITVHVQDVVRHYDPERRILMESVGPEGVSHATAVRLAFGLRRLRRYCYWW